MLSQSQKSSGFRTAVVLGAVTFALAAATAVASRGLVQDRRISMPQATELAARAQQSAEFPIVVNDQVVKWLNFYLATPDGREKVKLALERMQNVQPTIDKKLAEYRLPRELLAVPFIESGYQNLEPAHNKVHGAGLWQIIPSTAKAYALRVDGSVDERMNVELSTDAALRLLYGDKLRFNDWQLSALSYNGGAKTVQAAIDQLGTRDPWALVGSGVLSHETTDYLPKLMAAILILKNPELL